MTIRRYRAWRLAASWVLAPLALGSPARSKNNEVTPPPPVCANGALDDGEGDNAGMSVRRLALMTCAATQGKVGAQRFARQAR